METASAFCRLVVGLLCFALSGRQIRESLLIGWLVSTVQVCCDSDAFLHRDGGGQGSGMYPCTNLLYRKFSEI